MGYPLNTSDISLTVPRPFLKVMLPKSRGEIDAPPLESRGLRESHNWRLPPPPFYVVTGSRQEASAQKKQRPFLQIGIVRMRPKVLTISSWPIAKHRADPMFRVQWKPNPNLRTPPLLSPIAQSRQGRLRTN